MNKKVFLHRLYHRERWRIAIFFSYDEKLKKVVKTIPGVAYSVTNRCFYVDDSEENLKLILKTLKDCAEADISELSGKPDEQKRPTAWQQEKQPFTKVIRRVESQPLKDQVRKDFPADRDTVAGDHAREVSRVDRPVSGGMDCIKEIPQAPRANETRYSPVEFRINEREGYLVVKFTGRYSKDWIGEMQSYGRCRYDARSKEWLLPWSKNLVDSLADYFSSLGVRVNVVKQQVNAVLQEERKESADRIRLRDLGDEAREGLKIISRYLDENRYSIRTKESYMALLEFYFRYFSPKAPGEISKQEISEFITDHIIRLGYSPSYQNQMISAIKMYYQVAGMGKVNPELLERPRRMRALPKVLSREEVSSILNSARNIKHKLLLWMIYSCGLRRSEVTNIRLRDLDRERSILHIRQGKGNVDRIVPLSPMVWERIDEYRESYCPIEYLFEGQTGGRYSTESVYRVFKDAMHRAGIIKDVGVHCLRHSYATHLHEKGLDIRYIQELLGHKSTRTTEIYTHVSRRNLMQVRSPIEDLDLK